MGMTVTTLHVLGMDREALVPLLAPSDLLRDENTPWLSVVPEHDADFRAGQRLDKLGKKLSREKPEVRALWFYYFDDDLFTCRLYGGGKLLAQCRSGASWTKLGKALDELFGEEGPAKALRLSGRCFGLEEQVKLLEETLGTALLDIQEEPPRRVLRGDATAREIKAREAALHKRPNRYRLTELDREDWPESLRLLQCLFEHMSTRWEDPPFFGEALFVNHPDSYLVPGGSGLIAYPYTMTRPYRDGLFLLNGRTGEGWELAPLPLKPVKVLWQTKAGDLVISFLHILRQEDGPGSCFRSCGRGCVICMSREGEERWRFEPELTEYQHLTPVQTSAQGRITLLVKAIDGQIQSDALLFQLDGETGQLLRSRQVPVSEQMFRLAPVEELDAFVTDSMKKKELVLLDSELRERARWPQRGNLVTPDAESVCGTVLWNNNFYLDARVVERYDLKTGDWRKISLELPSFLRAHLPDGRMIGTTEQLNRVIVFDENGKVTARCHLQGHLGRVIVEPDRVCVEEFREQENQSYLLGADPNKVSVHVWRLDPIS